MLATFSSASIALLEQARQCLQHSLAMPIVAQAAGLAGAQVWHIGSLLRLLATRPPAGPAAPAVPHGSSPGCPTLLIYDYVPGKLGAQLRAQGIYYADAVGNAWVQHPQLLVSVQGRGRPKAPAPAVASPASQVHLLRLLFQLMLAPGLATQPPASLAARTGLPPAALGRAQRELAALGLWPGAGPVSLPAAVPYWVQHYAKTLRPRLNPVRYRARRPAELAGWLHQPPPACYWSGEAAAHLLLGTAPPPAGRLLLHSTTPRAQLVQQLGLVPAAQGAIEVLNAFAPVAGGGLGSDPRCVPPLLVYADLLANCHPPSALRAEEIRTRYLAAMGPLTS